MAGAVIGLDVGGANLKAAHTAGPARTVPFALWRNAAGLADALKALLAPLPPAERLAVTMTGELCDCFETKRQGVNAILDAVEQVAAGRRVRVWGTGGGVLDADAARAIGTGVILLLIMGAVSHNLYRFTWVWFGAFQAIALHCLRTAESVEDSWSPGSAWVPEPRPCP